MTPLGRAALLNAFFVSAPVEATGLLVAFMPRPWLLLFTADPTVISIGSDYLRFVGPTYGFIAIMTELYFAGQGAGRIGWPFAGEAVRVLAALVATSCVFLVGTKLGVAFGLVTIGAMASGVISLIGFARVTWARRG